MIRAYSVCLRPPLGSGPSRSRTVAPSATATTPGQARAAAQVDAADAGVGVGARRMATWSVFGRATSST